MRCPANGVDMRRQFRLRGVLQSCLRYVRKAIILSGSCHAVHPIDLQNEIAEGSEHRRRRHIPWQNPGG
jgi:hypothetical protein